MNSEDNQILSSSEDNIIRIRDVATARSTYRNYEKLDGTFNQGLNLSEANFKEALGLSDTNLILLYQREAHGFNEKEGERFTENLNDLIGN